MIKDMINTERELKNSSELIKVLHIKNRLEPSKEIDIDKHKHFEEITWETKEGNENCIVCI